VFLPRITHAALYVALSSATLLSQPPQAPPAQAPRPQPADPGAGKKHLLAIADPIEWYGAPNYHHQAASHAMAVIDRLGRESGVYTTMIRTDLQFLTKGKVGAATGRNLDYFDAIFYFGEGPWKITDQQKADLLSFVRDDGKGFFAAHAGNGGHNLEWAEYAEMVGGNLISEFTAPVSIMVEDPQFPGMDAFPREFTFKEEYTIVGPNYSRERNHVIMSLNASKLDLTDPAIARAAPRFRLDKDFPIVWAKQYGKGRVFFSSFGHDDGTMDDPRIQKMYLGAIKWLMGLADADITPRPMPAR
jgi:hypothetical protein